VKILRKTNVQVFESKPLQTILTHEQGKKKIVLETSDEEFSDWHDK
jgi:hypothetical protein